MGGEGDVIHHEVNQSAKWINTRVNWQKHMNMMDSKSTERFVKMINDDKLTF